MGRSVFQQFYAHVRITFALCAFSHKIDVQVDPPFYSPCLQIVNYLSLDEESSGRQGCHLHVGVVH